MSAKTGAGLDELRAALARVPVARARRRRRDAAVRRPRVHAARRRHGRDRDALVGRDRRGRRAARRAVAVAPCACARCRCTTRAVERREAGQRVAVNLPQLERRDLARGDVLVAPGHFAPSYRLDIRLDGARAGAGRGHGARRNARGAGARRSRRRVRAAPARERGRRRARRPRRAPDRHDGRRRHRARPVAARAASTERASRRSSAETQPRSCTRPLPRATLQRLFSDDELAPLPSARRARLLGGLARRAARVGARTARSARRREPARPGPPDRGAPARAPVGAARCSSVERHGAKAYLPGATAALGDRAAAADALEARLAEEEIVKVDDRDLAAYLERRRASAPRRRRLRGLDGALRSRRRAAARAAADHARGVPRRARRRAADRAAAARALRRRRADDSPRRRAFHFGESAASTSG